MPRRAPDGGATASRPGRRDARRLAERAPRGGRRGGAAVPATAPCRSAGRTAPPGPLRNGRASPEGTCRQVFRLARRSPPARQGSPAREAASRSKPGVGEGVTTRGRSAKTRARAPLPDGGARVHGARSPLPGLSLSSMLRNCCSMKTPPPSSDGRAAASDRCATASSCSTPRERRRGSRFHGAGTRRCPRARRRPSPRSCR